MIDDIHKLGTEIEGGYLLIQAENLDNAVENTHVLPIDDFERYAQMRPFRYTV